MPLEGKDGWDSSAKPEISGVSPHDFARVSILRRQMSVTFQIGGSRRGKYGIRDPGSSPTRFAPLLCEPLTPLTPLISLTRHGLWQGPNPWARSLGSLTDLHFLHLFLEAVFWTQADLEMPARSAPQSCRTDHPQLVMCCKGEKT